MGIISDSEQPSLTSQSSSNVGWSGEVEHVESISFSECCCTSCVGIIDIVNSTRITAALNRHQMARYYCLFINWATALVRSYGGKVIKNMGDGLLFYFPLAHDSESLRIIRDCLNCSITLSMLHPNINMKFLSESLPDLNYRISLDYGEVTLAKTMDGPTLDIFSTTVNTCAKINSLAAPNTIVVGGDMYQVSKNLNGYSFQELKKAISVANRLYPVYSVTESKSVVQYLSSIRRPDRSTRLKAPDIGRAEVDKA